MAELAILLPEEIYSFYAQSEAPEDIDRYGPFACLECQPPIGANKPEGVADLPPYPIRNGRQQPDQQQQSYRPQQQQSQQQQQHNRQFFQKGKGKQSQQPPQKKIVTTVEISPDFVNKDLGTWAKPKPASNSSQAAAPAQPITTASTVTPQSQHKPASTFGFNPQKTASFNPQSTTSSNTTTMKPSSFNPQSASKPSPVEPNNTATPTITAPTYNNNNDNNSGDNNDRNTDNNNNDNNNKNIINHNNNTANSNTTTTTTTTSASVWGKPVQTKQKPKTQSFAQLLEKESTVKPATQHHPPQFRPENAHGSAPTAVAAKDEKNWPSLSDIKPKKDTKWSQVKP